MTEHFSPVFYYLFLGFNKCLHFVFNIHGTFLPGRKIAVSNLLFKKKKIASINKSLKPTLIYIPLPLSLICIALLLLLLKVELFVPISIDASYKKINKYSKPAHNMLIA